ncbi:hypothetical protein CBR_g40854 [Chara braunii]|uniref:Vacuolar protein sorting-associated protein 45 n=1 Tax=Chara braunii TaxID=69332 RepID=A0A388K2B1_CHABU|nr:hypothetical protein CBR_g40854 [Chara braunii]|eukprot:GBG64155.1 hypothetical protein CBR_g40854 [Chara braunii]
MKHLKAVFFVRVTAENIHLLKRHLASPRFGEFHFFFSNILKTTHLQILADADEQQMVKQVQEFFGDYHALDPYHFTLDLPQNHLCMMTSVLEPVNMGKIMDRVVEGIASVFLAMKKRPAIRHQRTSDIARRIAQDCSKLMYEQESQLFDFRRSENAALLLVMDRRDDPVTPLLNQWTYQAMVHELIGLKHNRVDLRGRTRVPKDQQEVVLSSEQDPFFKANMFENFGDLGMNIKKMVDDFQQRAKSNQNLQSIEDMARFVENYPEYRKLSGNVSKHVTLMSELSQIVDERQLMSVSQTEQELACNSGQAAAFEAVMGQLDNRMVTDLDRLRLVMLYSLRYERDNSRQREQLMTKLASKPSKFKPGLVYTLLRHCGMEKRTGDLFGNRDIFNRAQNMARRLKGVDNVYAQHQPLLSQIIENITKGRVKDVEYPFVGKPLVGRPSEVVVFVVGGTTYEEARAVALNNAANTGVRVLLGGTTVLNSASFLTDLEELHALERSSQPH